MLDEQRYKKYKHLLVIKTFNLFVMIPFFTNSALQNASLEIFLMLSWAFILWGILSWLLKPQAKYVITAYSEYQDPKINLNIPRSQKMQPKKIITEQIATLQDKNSENIGDNFSVIIGITPKIEKLLHDHHIVSYQDIVDLDIAWLKKILEEAGGMYKKNNPANWPDQARLAHDEKWSELEEYQNILKGKKK